MGYFATTRTRGPLLLSSPALMHWGLPRRLGLCRHHAPLWATSGLVVCFEVLRTLQTGRVQ